MLVKFDASIELPISETCFLSITIPTKHKSFEDFQKYFDITVKLMEHKDSVSLKVDPNGLDIPVSFIQLQLR